MIITYFFLFSSSLVLSSEGHKFVFEQVIEFVRKGLQVAVIGVLDHGSADNCLEELSLEDNLGLRVDVFRLDPQLGVEISMPFILLFKVGTVLIFLFDGFSKGVATVHIVEEVELAGFSTAQQGEVVLLALDVNSIELGERGL